MDDIKSRVESNKNSEQKISEKLMNKYLNDIKEEHVLLKILHQLQNNYSDENQNINITETLAQLMSQPEYDLSRDVINKVSRNEHLIRSLLDIVSESYVPKKEIKVLEINTTRGLMSSDIDSQLASSAIYPIDVNYTIAVKSIDDVPDNLKNKAFKMVEWKTEETVFPPDITSFELIVYKDSTDLWQLDTEQQLQETYDSLGNKGYLLSVFRYQLTEPELALNQMNGKKNLKNADLEQRISDYLRTAQSVGFSLIGRKSDSIGSMALLMRKILIKPTKPEKDCIVEIKSDSMDWFESLKEKLIEVKENDEKETNVWLIANDSPKNGMMGFINCLRLEPGGECVRCLFDCDQMTKMPINFNDKLFKELLNNDLPINVLRNGKLGTFRHLSLPASYDKRESDEYFLNLGPTRDLAALNWYDMKNLEPPQTVYSVSSLQTKQVKCNIYSAGMNFRDVMLATGINNYSSGQNLRHCLSNAKVVSFPDLRLCSLIACSASSSLVVDWTPERE